MLENKAVPESSNIQKLGGIGMFLLPVYKKECTEVDARSNFERNLFFRAAISSNPPSR
jgi:hypothetical protein